MSILFRQQAHSRTTPFGWGISAPDPSGGRREDTSYQSWLVAAGTGIVAAIVMRVLQAIVRHRLAALAASTATRWDEYVISMLSRTKFLFWLVFAVFVGSQMLDLSTHVQAVIRGGFVIALLVQGGLWAGVLIRSYLSDYRKKKLDENPADVSTLRIISFVANTILWSIVSPLVMAVIGDPAQAM